MDPDSTMTLSSPPSPSKPETKSRDARFRRGIISLADAGDLLSLGARHGALRYVLSSTDENGVEKKRKGRTMYAETERERKMLLDAIRDCRWNEDRCPVSLSVRAESGSDGEGSVVEHDFGNGYVAGSLG